MSGDLVVVVGGGGFIRSHLVANLLSEGRRVRSTHALIGIGTLLCVMRTAYALDMRPNFAKMAPVIGELRKRFPDGGHTIIHTGQHCDQQV